MCSVINVLAPDNLELKVNFVGSPAASAFVYGLINTLLIGYTTFVYINLYNQTYQNQLGMSNDTSFDKTNVARKLQININLK